MSWEEDYFNRLDAEAWLVEKCNKAFVERKVALDAPLRRRVESELEIILRQGHSQLFWFLYVATIHRLVFASAALLGSATAYLLGIADINPLDYGLHFECFINDQDKTEPVPMLMTSEKGYDNILSCFQRFLGKNKVGIIQDKHCDYVYLSFTDNLRSLCKADWDKDGKRLILDTSKTEADKLKMLCIAIHKSEKVTALHKILSELSWKINPHKIPLDDVKTYEFLMSSKDSLFVNLESNAKMHKLCSTCRSIEDLAACLALSKVLNRETYAIFCENFTYRFAALTDIPLMQEHLHKTGGILLYVEQFMQIITDVSGLSLEDAFLAYKLMRAGKHRKIAEWEQRFYAAALSKGYRKDEFELIINYLFAWTGAEGLSMKAYYVGQALLQYRLAYLQLYYG